MALGIISGQCINDVEYLYTATNIVDEICADLFCQRYTWMQELDELGRPTKQTLPNEVETRFAYDAVSRVREMVNELTMPSRILSKFTHGYDEVGNRTSRREVLGGFNGAGGPADGVDTQYGYDLLDRLTSATQPQENFSYDAVGNRTERGQSYNNLNQLLTDGKFSYTYDLNGNRTSKRDLTTNEETEYFWDSDDQLRQVNIKNGAGSVTKIVRFKYDGLGRRIEKQLQDNEVMSRSYTRQYVYDGEDVIQEQDAVGNVVATYLHGPGIDDPITMLRDVDGNHSIDHDAEVWHFTKDTLGSIKDLTDPQGRVVQRYRYSAGGLQTLELDESRLDSKAIENPYGFASGRLDRETGNVNFRLRDLDPYAGVWLSFDKAWPIGSLNGYDYVGGNPVNYTDPLGLWRDPRDIFREALEHERSSSGTNGPGNAFQHCFASCMMTAENGMFATFLLGQGFEELNSIRDNQSSEAGEMDTSNNAFGSYLGERVGSGMGSPKGCSYRGRETNSQRISRQCAASCGAAADARILTTLTTTD